MLGSSYTAINVLHPHRVRYLHLFDTKELTPKKRFIPTSFVLLDLFDAGLDSRWRTDPYGAIDLEEVDQSASLASCRMRNSMTSLSMMTH